MTYIEDDWYARPSTDLDFTFAIAATQHNFGWLPTIVRTIVEQKIPNYEIIIACDKNPQIPGTRWIPFDESQRRGWITKKKNQLVQAARHENIVLMHDYIYLTPNWYSAFTRFGNDFKACMNRIENADGTRYRDWCLWDYDGVPGASHLGQLLPYSWKHLSKKMYFSGAYWVAKTEVMKEFPLDESLVWGESEDVEWSKRIREKYDFSINEKSVVRLMKMKDRVFHEISP